MTKQPHGPRRVDRLIDDVLMPVRRWSPRSKVLLLLVVAIIIYGVMIADTWINDPTASYDIDIYRARTQAILDGELLYRDVHTETPPLINYFLVPAQVMGGAEHYWIWGAYQTAFAFLLSVMLYLVLRRHDEIRAFQVAFLALLCPFLIDETHIGEDGALVAFVFFSGLLLMLLERNRYAAIAIGIGIWTKMWSVLLLPTQFLRLPSWRERGMLVVIVGAVTLLVTVPFLVLCPEEFLEFLEFYFLGDPERSSGGISMWNFLSIGGYGVPETLELAMVLGSLLVAYLFAHWKQMGVWQSVTLVVVVFIVFYPKMHMGYYILPTVLLAVWGARDWRVAVLPYLAFVPLSLTSGFLPEEDSTISNLFENSWIIGLFLSLAGTLLFVLAAYLALRQRPFLEMGPSAKDQEVDVRP